MPEPSLKYCTVREGDEEWHLECRFSDGQKYAAIWVDGEFPQLAERVASLLNGGTWTDERPTEPGEYWLSLPPARRRGVYEKRRAVYVGIGERVKLHVWDDLGLWLGCLDDSYFDGAKWSRRETPADPFAKTDPMRTDQDGREYNHSEQQCPDCKRMVDPEELRPAPCNYEQDVNGNDTPYVMCRSCRADRNDAI